MSKIKRINVVTLGCSKNIVDSEVLMNQLRIDGWKISHDSNDESIKNVIINTCGFIEDAKEESIDTILRFIDAKKKGLIDHIYVMGCLSQRYKSDLKLEMPEVDGIYGVNELQLILNNLNSEYYESETINRYLTTPNHYAYLKISEGCNWGCSFCAIPLIRGKHISRSIDSLVKEANALANQGVKELIIIAQDSTYYGVDLYGERKLGELLTKLSEINGITWIRLHYAFPAHFPADLIEVIKSNPKICKYLDIPLQHISNKMLQKMHRGIDKHATISLINRIRNVTPSIVVRTTIMVGHPGETEKDFNELLEFVRETKFERLGVFKYSEEEGTFAAQNYNDDVPLKVKEDRFSQIMNLQNEISNKLNKNKIGQKYKVIIDRVEGDFLYGRTEYDSPEVDQEVIIKKPNFKIIPGDFVNAVITSSDDYDLFGEVID